MSLHVPLGVAGSDRSAVSSAGASVIARVEKGDRKYDMAPAPFPGKSMFGRQSDAIIASRKQGKQSVAPLPPSLTHLPLTHLPSLTRSLTN